MSKAPPRQEAAAGAPMWIVTFADLMSLLMTFFVLLLSFSEMDLQKYKQVAGSLKYAFGVQREIEAQEVPKGTSIIAQEFSPGRPEPTPVNEVRQKTIEDDKQTLEFTDAMSDDVVPKPDYGEAPADDDTEQAVEAAEELLQALQQEVDKGLIQIQTDGANVRIRIRERGSFPSGMAVLREDFMPVIAKLREGLKRVEGQVLVAGHTDDVPIHTERFRSNWELSAARAVTVVHELLADPGLDERRFVVEGYGDADPLLPNDSEENRAINRRVEITIVKAAPRRDGEGGDAEDGASLSVQEVPAEEGVQ